MNKAKIKELEREIKLLKEYKELLEACLELKEKLNGNKEYIPVPQPYPVYPYSTYPNYPTIIYTTDDSTDYIYSNDPNKVTLTT